MPQLEAIYRSSARRAFLCVWLFRVLAVAGVLYAAASLLRLSLPDDRELVDSLALVPRWLGLSMAALVLTSLLTAVVRLGAIVALITWLHRATKNLPALGVADAGVTPGWAIGCWFVPFVNIIAPCIVVLRVWRASDPNAAPGSPNRGEGWLLLYAWWGALLVEVAAGLAAWFARAHSPGLLTRAQLWAYLCSAVAIVVMSLLAVPVVREIERRQTEKSQLQAFS